MIASVAMLISSSGCFGRVGGNTFIQRQAQSYVKSSTAPLDTLIPDALRSRIARTSFLTTDINAALSVHLMRVHGVKSWHLKTDREQDGAIRKLFDAIKGVKRA